MEKYSTTADQFEHREVYRCVYDTVYWIVHTIQCTYVHNTVYGCEYDTVYRIHTIQCTYVHNTVYGCEYDTVYRIHTIQCTYVHNTVYVYVQYRLWIHVYGVYVAIKCSV